jgi:hypothetical protein
MPAIFVVGPAAPAELEEVFGEEDDDELDVVVVTELDALAPDDFESLLQAARTSSRPALMTIDRFMLSPTAADHGRIAAFRV